MSSLATVRETGGAPLFRDRHTAGAQLATALLAELTSIAVSAPSSSNPPACIVYALPRGGLPIAVPIATALGCPLDILVAKKIAHPDHPEFALGAVTTDGHTVWSPYCKPAQRDPQLADAALHKAQAQWRQFTQQRQSEPPSPQQRIAIVVDDGIATGMTMAAAVATLRDQHPAQIWIAAPVAPVEAVPWLQTLSDRLILLATPTPFYSVSRFYQAFPQLTMVEAIACLQRNSIP
jgi:putative phosphoribosyl transferase